jgi:hypothetical protein
MDWLGGDPWAILPSAATILAVWKLFSERKTFRTSGKILSYSVRIVPHQRDGKSDGALRWVPGLRRFFGAQFRREKIAKDIDVYIWNSGSEEISSEDFFREKPLSLIFSKARLKNIVLTRRTHASVGFECAPLGRYAEWCEPQLRMADAASRVSFKFLPPGHGAIVRASLVEVEQRIPLVRLIGPLRGLKRIQFVGALFALPLEDLAKMKRLSLLVGSVVNISLALMGATIIFMVDKGFFDIHKWSYWAGLVVMGIFQIIYMLATDARKQLGRNIPDKLAFWDASRSEWG